MGNTGSKKNRKSKAISENEKGPEPLTADQIADVQRTWMTVKQDIQGYGIKFFVRLVHERERTDTFAVRFSRSLVQHY